MNQWIVGGSKQMGHDLSRTMKNGSVLLIVCTLAMVSCTAQESIHIPDPQLKALIENELWVLDPTPTDMLGLTSLNLSSREIKDLTGLEYAKNLHSLQLTHNQVEDLSPLSKLTNLRRLVPNNNQISDLSPLSGLIQLRHLDLHENQIDSVTPLSGLVHLEYLNLHENQIRHLSGLSNLRSLQHLDLNNNPIADLSSLSTLDKLPYLNLSNNQIYDISALSGLTHLTTLYLYNNRISDVSALSGLSNLQLLSLPNNQISDISALSGLTNLTELYLNYNQISDVSALSGMTNLSMLWLHDNPLNQQACDTYIPWIVANNPGIIEVRHAPCTTQYNGITPEEDIPPARKIHVDDDASNDPGPDDLSISDPQEDGTDDHAYDSIQEAIEQARDADTILVHEGTYYETLNLMGKCLDISRFVPDASKISAYPVIDAQNTGTVVTFNQGEDPSCQLSGLVLTGGLDNNSGAIACVGASPTIENCLIVGNRSTGPLGAIIYCEDSHSLFQNLTVYANSSGASGSAFRFTECDATITNSIIWDNAASEITVASGNDPTIVFSDVQGTWPGLGNIATDPLFSFSSHRATLNSPTAVSIPGDYHVMSEIGRWNSDSLSWIADELTSPCIDAGDPSDSWTDEPGPHGARINMGAYGGTDQASCSLRVVPIMALWTFDESSGATAYDAVGGNHGKVYGATWTDGILDGALQFDGVDDYVDCGSGPALAPDLLTISMWIYAQATSTSRTILRKAGDNADKDYEFELFGARYPSFSFGHGSQSAVLYSSAVLPLNEWIHVTLTRDENEAAIHINGAQLVSKTFDFSPSATDHDLVIGGGYLQPFKGRIDDVQLYDSVLSAEDIKGLVHEADQ